MESCQNIKFGRIMPNLYIGNAAASIDAPTLQKHRISAMISITTEFLPEWESPTITSLVPISRHLLLPADDNPAMNLLPVLDSTCDWIDAHIWGNGDGDGGKHNVLVHCGSAVSRSPTICLAYWMHKIYPGGRAGNVSMFVKIYDEFSKHRWEDTWPHDTSTFMDQLWVWYRTGYEIWEEQGQEGGERVPKKKYRKYLENVWTKKLKEMNNEWKNTMGEDLNWGEETLGFTVVGIANGDGDVSKATWEEGKAIMLSIKEEDVWGRRGQIMHRMNMARKARRI